MAKKGSKAKNTPASEQQVARPKKSHFTNRANYYFQEVVAPIERSYRQAMGIGNYAEGVRIFETLQAARKEYRLLLYRNEWVKVKAK
ncbi:MULTISPECIES: hypothetical protein [Thermoactinomycetaceae]|uniref:Uncharacterized protein n=2 Tax=Thermoactinomycetaceae TaxID=186824 RepID=A0A4R2S2V9_9BACL|nr:MULTISPECIES: hypothetical protein [Thermoactinomycetaceae]MDQ0417330.1 hypothetical protein [Croceifilum oryzae]TCP70693.1 hypothetical protein EDD57_101136 [Baia soyae]